MAPASLFCPLSAIRPSGQGASVYLCDTLVGDTGPGADGCICWQSVKDLFFAAGGKRNATCGKGLFHSQENLRLPVRGRVHQTEPGPGLEPLNPVLETGPTSTRTLSMVVVSLI